MQDFSSPLAQPFDFPEGEHGVLLIHGFTGTPAHVRLVGEGLKEKGFAVQGILLPGHGESPEAMKKAAWQDWLLAARMAAQKMKAKYRYFSVGGLSMGGVIALILAEEMNVNACVPIAAPVKTTNRFQGIAPLAAPFYPMIHKRADGARATLDARYDIGFTSYPTSSVHHLSVLMRRARQNLGFIRCPILVIQSRKDQTVTQDSPELILRGVSSRKKAQLWLENAPHVCTISPEYPRITEAMASFLRDAEE